MRRLTEEEISDIRQALIDRQDVLHRLVKEGLYGDTERRLTQAADRCRALFDVIHQESVVTIAAPSAETMSAPGALLLTEQERTELFSALHMRWRAIKLGQVGTSRADDKCALIEGLMDRLDMIHPETSSQSPVNSVRVHFSGGAPEHLKDAIRKVFNSPKPGEP